MAGTGPWEREEIQNGAFWKFKARKEHHNKAPFFANMTFFEIPEESTRLANFQVGRIDTFAPAPDSLQSMAAIPDVQFMSQKAASESTLNIYGGWYWTGIAENCPDIAKICPAPGWDPDAPYVSSNPDPSSPEWERARKVREALSLAIDRDKIVTEPAGR